MFGFVHVVDDMFHCQLMDGLQMSIEPIGLMDGYAGVCYGIGEVQFLCICIGENVFVWPSGLGSGH